MKWQTSEIKEEEFAEVVNNPPARPTFTIGLHPGKAYKTRAPAASGLSIATKREPVICKSEPSTLKKSKTPTAASAPKDDRSSKLHPNVRGLTLASIAQKCDLGNNPQTPQLTFEMMWNIDAVVAQLGFGLSQEQVRCIKGRIAAGNEKAVKDARNARQDAEIAVQHC